LSASWYHIFYILEQVFTYLIFLYMNFIVFVGFVYKIRWVILSFIDKKWKIKNKWEKKNNLNTIL
jgi:hypothetical protein